MKKLYSDQSGLVRSIKIIRGAPSRLRHVFLLKRGRLKLVLTVLTDENWRGTNGDTTS